MINSMTVTNHRNESLTLELRSPENSGLAVLSVEGIGSPKASISLTDRAGLDGAEYNSARARTRNILISLRYLSKPDVETNRQKTYKYFPLGKEIRIDFDTDSREAYVIGHVESNEADIFSNEAGCMISVLCPESYMYDFYQAVTPFSLVTPLFEFPFSNESLVSPLLEMSEFVTKTEKTVVYNGDAPIGMLLHIHALGSASGVVITNSVTLENITIDSTKLAAIVGSDISLGDDIYISTVNGNKYAKLIRTSNEYNILSCLGSSPTWFQLEKGDNVFAYTATSGLINLQFEIISDVAYEGI